MKSILFKTIIIAMAAIAVSIHFVSCTKDPVEPIDETKNKLHEDPARMTIQLVECHLHADWNEIQQVGGPHQNPESPAKFLKRVQEMSFEVKPGKGWVLSEGSQPKFYVQKNGEYMNGTKFTPAPVYLMFINYYNAKGELMNNQFIENGQDIIHQHFFTPTDIRPTFDGTIQTDDNVPDKMIDYLYADTTPWDKSKHGGQAEITGDDNPLGFKGVIRFLKDRKEFNLKVRLYHGYQSKVNPHTGKPDPFYKPSATLIQNGAWDINVNIPFIVFWSRQDYIDIDDDQDVSQISEDSLDEESNKVVHSIMKTFNISWTEALQDFQLYTYKIDNIESGGIWL